MCDFSDGRCTVSIVVRWLFGGGTSWLVCAFVVVMVYDVCGDAYNLFLSPCNTCTGQKYNLRHAHPIGIRQHLIQIAYVQSGLGRPMLNLRATQTASYRQMKWTSQPAAWPVILWRCYSGPPRTKHLFVLNSERLPRLQAQHTSIPPQSLSWGYCIPLQWTAHKLTQSSELCSFDGTEVEQSGCFSVVRQGIPTWKDNWRASCFSLSAAWMTCICRVEQSRRMSWMGSSAHTICSTASRRSCVVESASQAFILCSVISANKCDKKDPKKKCIACMLGNRA